MKKIIIVLICALLWSNTSFSQEDSEFQLHTDEALTEINDERENTSNEEILFEEEKIIPLIESETIVPIGKQVFFDASSTKKISPSYGTPNYSWDMDDETGIKWGESIAHTFTKTGIYTIKLKVSQGRQSESVFQDLFVYDRTGVLIADETIAHEEIIRQAGEQGLYLKPILRTTTEGLSGEEEFIRKIQENLEAFKNSQVIIFYGNNTPSLQLFGQLWQKIADENKFNTTEKFWVQILETGSLSSATKIVQPAFSVIRPSFIFLTRPSVLNLIFKNQNSSQIVELANQRAIEHVIVDDRSSTSKFLILSNLISYFVTKGVSQNVIYFLLVVPFVTFLIAFFRQFVGMYTYGVYIPLMLTLSFLVLGLQFGILVFLTVMSISSLIRFIFEKIEMLYIPKIALLFSVLSFSFFLILGLGVSLQLSTNLSLAVFPMLMMVSLSEKFISTQATNSTKYALLCTGETIFISLVAYFIISWEWLQSVILALPEIIIIPIIGIIWLGSFTGLRVSEYFKFRNLFREDSQEE